MKNVKLLYLFSISCGMISSIVYVLHVYIGGALWEGYSHLKQPISDLTSLDAPNRELLNIFTNVYGVLTLIFAISVFVLIKINKNRMLNCGFGLLIVLESVSFFGYMLFPLESIGVKEDTFQNLMHIITTAIVVITTISSTFIIGISFIKRSNTKIMGAVIILSGLVITISGISTGVIISKEIPLTGLLERINIFTLQAMIFYISFMMFKLYRRNKNLRLL